MQTAASTSETAVIARPWEARRREGLRAKAVDADEDRPGREHDARDVEGRLAALGLFGREYEQGLDHGRDPTRRRPWQASRSRRDRLRSGSPSPRPGRGSGCRDRGGRRGAAAAVSSVMNESWAIGRPGHSLIGTRVRLFSSSVSVPFQPGSQKPAVAWTIRPEAPERRLALDAGDDVVRQLDPFLGAPEAELAGVDDERLVLVDDHLLGEVARRVAQVDRGHAVVVEHAERVAEAQVDAGRLDHRLVPRVDADPALLDERADRAVGEDGGRRHRPKSRTEGRRSASANTASARNHRTNSGR